MPKYDGTGPNGMGPKTGRGLGPCNDYCVGCGRRLGLGRSGFRRSTEPLSLEEQKKLLESELEAVKEDLATVGKELKADQ